MPSVITETVTAVNIDIGDIHDSNVVADVSLWGDDRMRVTYEDGQSIVLAKTSEIEVLRTVPTWADKIADFEYLLGQAIESVKASCHAAADSPELAAFQARIAAAESGEDILVALKRTDSDMAGLHLEGMWQALGSHLSDPENTTIEDAIGVVLAHLAERTSDLLAWKVPSSSAVMANVESNAFTGHFRRS